MNFDLKQMAPCFCGLENEGGIKNYYVISQPAAYPDYAYYDGNGDVLPGNLAGGVDDGIAISPVDDGTQDDGAVAIGARRVLRRRIVRSGQPGLRRGIVGRRMAPRHAIHGGRVVRRRIIRRPVVRRIVQDDGAFVM